MTQQNEKAEETKPPVYTVEDVQKQIESLEGAITTTLGLIQNHTENTKSLRHKLKSIVPISKMARWRLEHDILQLSYSILSVQKQLLQMNISFMKFYKHQQEKKCNCKKGDVMYA